MRAFLLRNIPDDIWVSVKQRAEAEGHSVRWVILQLLTRYARRGLESVSARLPRTGRLR